MKTKGSYKMILIAKNYWLAFCLFLGISIAACTGLGEKDKLIIKVSNPLSIELSDELLEINQEEFIEELNTYDVDMISVTSNGTSLPYQLIYDEYTGRINNLLVLADIPASEKLQITVEQDSNASNDFVKRTQAEISVKEGGAWKQVVKKNGTEQFEYQGGEFRNINYLRVPDQHTDHTYYIRYEGPGWESDKVAYRFYLDWRNAVDVFGKKKPEMVLHNVGLDGFDSYHEYADWGMDVLKVGKSLGLGSIAYWNGEKALRVAKTDSVTCHISKNGDLRSEIITNYYGWKDCLQVTDLKSVISIDAGSRLTKQKIYTSSNIENLCTGIVNHGVEVLKYEGDNGWSYIATYGKQSLNEDNLGMFLFYKSSDRIQLVDDEHSHVIVLKPTQNQLEYYYGAAWEEGNDPISNKEEFLSYLQQTLNRLDNPVLKTFK